MKKNVSIVVVALSIFCLGLLPAAAEEPAKVAGKWEMSMEGPQGVMTQTLTIEQKDAAIKGTLKGPRGGAPFEGAVDGNKVSFKVKRETPVGERVMEYTAKVDGDSMKGTVKFGENEREWTAKRSK